MGDTWYKQLFFMGISPTTMGLLILDIWYVAYIIYLAKIWCLGVSELGDLGAAPLVACSCKIFQRGQFRATEMKLRQYIYIYRVIFWIAIYSYSYGYIVMSSYFLIISASFIVMFMLCLYVMFIYIYSRMILSGMIIIEKMIQDWCQLAPIIFELGSSELENMGVP